MDKRTSFIDKLGVIGGTLGICVGASLFSFAEVAVLIYLILKSLGQDFIIMWKKIKKIFSFVDSDFKKKDFLHNVVINRQHQIYNGQEVSEENLQNLQKLYVSIHSKKK